MSLTYSEKKQISERYAKAAYSFAADEKATDAVLADMMQLKALMAEGDDLRGALSSPIIPADEKKALMAAVLKKAKAHDATTKIVDMLVDQGRALLLPMIAESVQALVHAANNVQLVKVTSAKVLDDKAQKALEKSLSGETKATLEFEYAEDASLLGGVVLEANGKQLDGSIAGRLQQLHKRMAAQ